MKERFSAGGSKTLWLQASDQALSSAGFTNVQLDEFAGVINAERNAPISIEVQEQEDEKVVLQIESVSSEDITQYKGVVARSFQTLLQKQKKQKPKPKTTEEPEKLTEPEQAEPAAIETPQTPPTEIIADEEIDAVGYEDPLGGVPEDLRPNTQTRFQNAFSDGVPSDLSTSPTEDNIFVVPPSVLNPDEASYEQEYANETNAEASSVKINPDGSIEETDIKTSSETFAASQVIPGPGGTASIPTGQMTGRINPTGTAALKEKKPWYKSEWFTLLMLVLLPPLGIFLMWYFKVFDKSIRKYLTVFFVLYTFLWAWLIFLLATPKSNEIIEDPDYYQEDTYSDEDSSDYAEEPEATQVSLVEDYWNDEATQNFVNQMPSLMSSYENLYLNGELGTQAGMETARTIIPQVQELSNAVLEIPDVGSESVVYPLQNKVNECANAFNAACDEATAAMDAEDYGAIESSTNAWNTAEGLFYEINYTYERVLQSASEEDGASSDSSSSSSDSSDSSDSSSSDDSDSSSSSDSSGSSDSGSDNSSSGSTDSGSSGSDNSSDGVQNAPSQETPSETTPSDNSSDNTEQQQQQTTTEVPTQQIITTEEVITEIPGTTEIIEEYIPVQ